MLIFQGFSIYVKYSASPLFNITEKKYVHFWSPVIYWSDIEMNFFIFILTVGHTDSTMDYLKYDGIAWSMITLMELPPKNNEYVLFLCYITLWVFFTCCHVNIKPVGQSVVSGEGR